MKCYVDMIFSADVGEGDSLRSYTFRRSLLAGSSPRVGDRIAVESEGGAVFPQVVSVTWYLVKRSAVVVVCEMGRPITAKERDVVVAAGWDPGN